MALEYDTAWKADRLAAARTVDEANHKGLLDALLKYANSKDPKHFPAGDARFARALGPETRLSWIAEMLPFLGHNDWNLDFASNWDSPENRRVSQRPLPEVVNPALGPDDPAPRRLSRDALRRRGRRRRGCCRAAGRRSASGRLRLRAQTRVQDLPRGGSHTIAVLGVQDRCGPWPGGRATVRPLTQRPYVNGRDGFGSGQAEGMVVGMADGSTRFISDKIDPEILEKLVTVHGGDKVDMSALDPQQQDPETLLVAPPAPQPQAATRWSSRPSLSPNRRLKLAWIPDFGRGWTSRCRSSRCLRCRSSTPCRSWLPSAHSR